jgi:5-methylcytosine-specific restriction endonuclease McrA
MAKKIYNVHAVIRAALRKVWLWSPIHGEAQAKARIRRGVYVCNVCATEVGPKDKNVDHIEPVTPLQGFKSLEEWGPALQRMFDPENHQILCLSCHKLKTSDENLQRKKLKQLNK